MTLWLQRARLRRPASGGWCIVVLRAVQPQVLPACNACTPPCSDTLLQLYPVNHIRNAAWNASRSQVTRDCDLPQAAQFVRCRHAAFLYHQYAYLHDATCDDWRQHVFILDADLVPDAGFYAALMKDYDK